MNNISMNPLRHVCCCCCCSGGGRPGVHRLASKVRPRGGGRSRLLPRVRPALRGRQPLPLAPRRRIRDRIDRLRGSWGRGHPLHGGPARVPVRTAGRRRARRPVGAAPGWTSTWRAPAGGGRGLAAPIGPPGAGVPRAAGDQNTGFRSPRRGNASEWSVVRIYPRFLRLIGPS
eukprot:844220-Prorocentrum_minimum.AAC.1